MSEHSTPREVWQRVEQRFSGSAMAKRFLRQIKESAEDRAGGEPVVDLGERSIDALVEKLAAEVEYLKASQRLQHAKKRLAHAADALAIQVFENEGFELGSEYVIDSQLCAVVRVGDGAAEAPRDSRQEAVRQLCGLITEARDNLMNAMQMVRDERLPSWFRELARVLSRTDGPSDEILAPGTRELIDRWLEHPSQAREWAELMADSSPEFLLQAARVIGLSKRWGG